MRRIPSDTAECRRMHNQNGSQLFAPGNAPNTAEYAEYAECAEYAEYSFGSFGLFGLFGSTRFLDTHCPDNELINKLLRHSAKQEAMPLI